MLRTTLQERKVSSPGSADAGGVVARLAFEKVVAGAALEAIAIASTAMEPFVSRRAIEALVIAWTSVEAVVAAMGDQGVFAGAADQGIGAAAAFQEVVPRAAPEGRGHHDCPTDDLRIAAVAAVDSNLLAAALLVLTGIYMMFSARRYGSGEAVRTAPVAGLSCWPPVSPEYRQPRSWVRSGHLSRVICGGGGANHDHQCCVVAGRS